MRTADLALQFLTESNIKIVRIEENFIQFRYQLNEIAFLCSYGAENYFSLLLLGLEQVPNGMLDLILNKCNEMNMGATQTKFYVKRNMVYASVETCYQSEKDFAFQFKNALSSLVKEATNYDNCNSVLQHSQYD